MLIVVIIMDRKSDGNDEKICTCYLKFVQSAEKIKAN